MTMCLYATAFLSAAFATICVLTIIANTVRERRAEAEFGALDFPTDMSAVIRFWRTYDSLRS